MKSRTSYDYCLRMEGNSGHNNKIRYFAVVCNSVNTHSSQKSSKKPAAMMKRRALLPNIISLHSTTELKEKIQLSGF
jgi:hypothetical protein